MMLIGNLCSGGLQHDFSSALRTDVTCSRCGAHGQAIVYQTTDDCSDIGRRFHEVLLDPALEQQLYLEEPAAPKSKLTARQCEMRSSPASTLDWQRYITIRSFKDRKPHAPSPLSKCRAAIVRPTTYH
jgi:hypothetical protein